MLSWVVHEKKFYNLGARANNNGTKDHVLTFHVTIHMKCKDLFSLKNKSKIKIVVCCIYNWRFKGRSSKTEISL